MYAYMYFVYFIFYPASRVSLQVSRFTAMRLGILTSLVYRTCTVCYYGTSPSFNIFIHAKLLIVLTDNLVRYVCQVSPNLFSRYNVLEKWKKYEIFKRA